MSATRTVDLFVPGRVCLLGEHSDWACSFYDPARNPRVTHGRCLAYGTSLGIHTHASAAWLPPSSPTAPTLSLRDADTAAVTPPWSTSSHSVRVLATLPDGTHRNVESVLDADTTRQLAVEGGFFAYVFGSLHVMLTHYHDKIMASYTREADESTHGDDSDAAAATAATAATSRLPSDEGADAHPSALPQRPALCVTLHSYKMDLPVQRGLSSSAAICVTVVRAFSRLFDLNLSTAQEMELAYAGETLTGSECGRLDQCVAYGTQCVDLWFGPSGVTVCPIDRPPNTPLYFVIANLLAGKDTRRILRDLHACYIEDATHHMHVGSDVDKHDDGDAHARNHHNNNGDSSSSSTDSSSTDSSSSSTGSTGGGGGRDVDGTDSARCSATRREELRCGVQNFLGQLTLDYVAEAAEAVRCADAERLGAVFRAYQADFDKYLMPVCEELRAPKLHQVLAHPRVQALSCGGKGIGSQGDGSVQFVCRNADEQAQLCALLNTDELRCQAMCFTV